MAGAVNPDTEARAMFFMITPNESSFQKVEDVPQYVQQVGTDSLSSVCDVLYDLLLCKIVQPSFSEAPQVTFCLLSFRD